MSTITESFKGAQDPRKGQNPRTFRGTCIGLYRYMFVPTKPSGFSPERSSSHYYRTLQVGLSVTLCKCIHGSDTGIGQEGILTGAASTAGRSAGAVARAVLVIRGAGGAVAVVDVLVANLVWGGASNRNTRERSRTPRSKTERAWTV